MQKSKEVLYPWPETPRPYGPKGKLLILRSARVMARKRSNGLKGSIPGKKSRSRTPVDQKSVVDGTRWEISARDVSRGHQRVRFGEISYA
jgi:hypothetical protein